MSSQPRNKSHESSLCCLSYINLTICSLFLAYRAYANDNNSLVVFIAFALVALLVSDMCMTALRKLPQEDGHHQEHWPKKFLLKLTVWVLTSALTFCIVYQFKPFFSFTQNLILFGLVIFGSAFTFYGCFINDPNKKRGNGEKINNFSPSSCNQDQDNNDKLCTKV